MKLPESVKEIRRRFLEKFPVPQGEPGEHFEQQVRDWTTMFAEQVVFETRDRAFGCKNAGGGRSRSKDVLAATFVPQGGTLIGWDLFIGTGTGKPRLAEDPDSMDLTGQVFEPVTGINHLGTPDVVVPIPDVPAPPVGNPPTSGYEEVKTALLGLITVMQSFNDELSRVQETLRRVESNQEQLVYQGSVCRLGGAGKLFPVKLG